MIAIEKIKIGTNKGRVKTLVTDSLLFLEIVIAAVIEDMKTTLNSDKNNKKLIGIKLDRSIFKINKINGEKIKKNKIKFRYTIKFFTNTIISRAKGDKIYCCNLASEKSFM